jgi:hypothetical protein
MRLCPSIRSSLLVVAVWRHIGISGTSVLGLPDFFRKGIALLKDLLLLLEVLLGHLVQVETVDLGVMRRSALLEGVDRGSVELVLDEFEGGAPE